MRDEDGFSFTDDTKLARMVKTKSDWDWESDFQSLMQDCWCFPQKEEPWSNSGCLPFHRGPGYCDCQVSFLLSEVGQAVCSLSDPKPLL